MGKSQPHKPDDHRTRGMLVQLLILGIICWWAGKVVYSIFLSPIKHIPGPLLLQLFPLYLRFRLGKGDENILVEGYRRTYGAVIRVGWNRVIFVDPLAAMEIYSTYRFNKTEEYMTFEYYGENVLSMRNREAHARRRRQMAHAFTKQNVALMEPTIISEGLIPLLENFSNAVGKGIDVFYEFHHFSWDVMGKLGFGKSFHMLKDGENHKAIQWMNSTVFYGFLTTIFSSLRQFSYPVGESMRKLITDSLDGTSKIFKNSTLTRQEMVPESFIQLFAGTDTTSNSMTWFFYLLATHPQVEAKLVEELRNSGIFEMELIPSNYADKLPYFEATLKESMRLLPAIALTPWRVVPPGGRLIKGYFIPEGAVVGVSMYSLYRSSEIWENPDLFVPERWENFKPQEGSYIPFLIGPRACLGKNLALLELRIVLLNVLKRYRLSLPKVHEKMEFNSFPTLKPKSNHLIMNVELR